MGILKYALFIFLIENTAEFVFGNEVTEAFKCFNIVPDYVPVPPKCRVKVEYDCNLHVELGNKLTPTETKKYPKVTYKADQDEYYALCMSDHDVPSPKNSTLGEFLHWLVVNIPGDEVNNGEALAEYNGPEPPIDTGFHRYVFLVYKQPYKMNFNEERLNNTSTDGRYKFSISGFADKYNFGNPIAGNFFLAEYDG